jgi:hypothetical protein
MSAACDDTPERRGPFGEAIIRRVLRKPLPSSVSTGKPYGHRLTKMQEDYTPEQLWILIRRYEALILKLLEQLDRHD